MKFRLIWDPFRETWRVEHSKDHVAWMGQSGEWSNESLDQFVGLFTPEADRIAQDFESAALACGCECHSHVETCTSPEDDHGYITVLVYAEILLNFDSQDRIDSLLTYLALNEYDCTNREQVHKDKET